MDVHSHITYKQKNKQRVVTLPTLILRSHIKLYFNNFTPVIDALRQMFWSSFPKQMMGLGMDVVLHFTSALTGCFCVSAHEGVDVALAFQPCALLFTAATQTCLNVFFLLNLPVG